MSTILQYLTEYLTEYLTGTHLVVTSDFYNYYQIKLGM